MRHIDKIIIKQATSDSRAASSCSSDIDRQELINNYGNDHYLSKWGDIKGTDEPTHWEVEALDGQDHLPVNNDDDASLISYNSVRDGTISRNTIYLPYQVHQANQEITLWQGYGGNIYFDPVRCRALRINSSKPNQKKAKNQHDKISKHRLTKSCHPKIEFHTVDDNQFQISYSASSFRSLGSLRISSREDKKKNSQQRTQPQSCKLRKGFAESDQSRYVYNHRSYSTPESLVVSGGQVNGKADPIDSVYRLNTKSRLSSKSREGSSIHQNLPSLISEHRDDDQPLKLVNDGPNDVEDVGEGQTRLPRVDQTALSKRSKDVSEPTPVLIIPFATLDDPVEIEANTTINQKKGDFAVKNETGTSKSSDSLKKQQPDIEKPTKHVKPDVQRPVKPVSKPVTQKPVKPGNPDKPERVKNTKDCKLQQSVSYLVPTHIVNITGEISPRVSPRYDFQVRREISNSSLGNYLQAVPQSRKTVKLPIEQKKPMPRLSYTQRSRETDFDTNDACCEEFGLATTSLYGGYIPSTRSAHNFHVELRNETTSDSSQSVTSPTREDKRHVTKSLQKRTGTKNDEKQSPVNEKCHLPVIGMNV